MIEYGRYLPSTEAELLSSRSPPIGFFGLRLRVWMPSFLMAKGRFTPCSLKYNPQALQTGSPSLFRRHSVVVRVPQFVQQRPNLRVAVWNEKSYQQFLGLSTMEMVRLGDLQIGLWIFSSLPVVLKVWLEVYSCRSFCDTAHRHCTSSVPCHRDATEASKWLHS